MENSPIPDQKNVSTYSGVTFLHPCDYYYQHVHLYPPGAAVPGDCVGDRRRSDGRDVRSLPGQKEKLKFLN